MDKEQLTDFRDALVDVFGTDLGMTNDCELSEQHPSKYFFKFICPKCGLKFQSQTKFYWAKTERKRILRECPKCRGGLING